MKSAPRFLLLALLAIPLSACGDDTDPESSAGAGGGETGSGGGQTGSGGGQAGSGGGQAGSGGGQAGAGGQGNNQAPVADAGADQTSEPGAPVMLDGSGSTDPEGDTLTHVWTQTAGQDVSLSDADTAQPSFVAPAALGLLTFELTVTDPQGASSTDSVTIDVEDGLPPTGTASPLDVLGLDEAVVVTFNEAMNPASLALGGSLAQMSDGGAWSTVNAENDTLTLAPKVRWESGVQTLDVDAGDLAGNPGHLALTYTIRLAFQTFQSASVVIGQPDFAGYAANHGGPVAADGFFAPYGSAAYDPVGDTLFLSDYHHSRVLAFAGIPTQNGATASFALGQSGLETTVAGVSATAMSGPEGVSVSGGKLLLTDFNNNRITVYDPVPTSAPGTAQVAVGQPSLESAVTGCTSQGLKAPEAHFTTPDGKLIVADSGQNRVLVWNTLPNASGLPADLVLGQSEFTTCAKNDDNQDGVADAAPTARTMEYPAGAWSDGEKLVVIDERNNRLLVWSTFPTTSFQAADFVLGQGDFTHFAPNDADQDGVNDGQPSAATLNDPYLGVWSNGVQLIVDDGANNRLLIWDTFPTASFQPADIVLGQSDFTHRRPNDDNQDDVKDASASARTFDYPQGIAVLGDKLFVTDGGNSRYLVFTSP